MAGPLNTLLSVKVYHCVEEAGEAAWDELSAGRPFQSAAWYRYGEQVMQDCEPVYLVVFKDGRAIARSTFWVIRNEPLPVPIFIYNRLKPLLQRWPLFICRSPLSNSSGLILPEPPLREMALSLISAEAERQARLAGASFLILDFLSQAEVKASGWPRGFASMAGGDPGTSMKVEWASFEDYIGTRDARNRRRIAYNKRKITEQGIQVTRCRTVPAPEDALSLIRRVEAKYRSPANPWIPNMLEKMGMVESTFLEARVGHEMVGCELLLYDNGAQLPTALGHAGSASYDYLEMMYTNLCDAMEKGCKVLRWGSGSYDIKRHLGFELVYENHAVFSGVGWFARILTWAASLFNHREAI